MSPLLNHNDYTVAWIAVLQIEAKAALGVLDKKHDGHFESVPGDDFIYTGGEINGHNLVIATLPAGQTKGVGAAAALVSQVKLRFPRLWFSLLVGIAAGLPNLSPKDKSKRRDIRLGDVLVCVPDKESTGIFHYDLGQDTENGFFQNGRQAETPAIVRSAIGHIQLNMENPFKAGNQFAKYLADFQQQRKDPQFSCPSQEQDQLYEKRQTSNPFWQATSLIEREPRDESERTCVWYGAIGSGNSLMRNATKRDELRDNHDLIGLEMEAAGVMNSLPAGVIRGVSDYGDAQKSKDWQPYAAAVAAVYAKGILHTIHPKKVTTVQRKSPRPSWLVPFDQRKQLVGRSKEIEKVEDDLFPRHWPGKVAIEGLGGMGKSRMATEIAHRTKRERPSCSVFWVQGTDLPSFERAYLRIGLALNIPGIADAGAEVKLLVKQHLCQEAAGQWLLILDNADDEELWVSRRTADGKTINPLMDHIPKSSQGAILITTRSHQIAVKMAQKNVVKLRELSEDDALAMFKNLLIIPERVDNPKTSSTLLDRLTYLPLALVQAASYFNENEHLTVDEYLQLFDQTEDATIQLLSEDFEDEDRYQEVRNPVAATWLISFEQLRRKKDSSAAEFLSFLACLDVKSIPQSLFPTDSAATNVISNEMTKAIGTLIGYSFIQRQQGSHRDPLYDMHRLVHLATRNWLRRENSLTKWLKKAAERLLKAFPYIDHPTKETWMLYLPHAEKVCALLEITEGKEWANLVKMLGKCYSVNGEYARVVDCCQTVLSWAENHLGRDHFATLNSCQELGKALNQAGAYTEAEVLNQRAVGGLTKDLGNEDASTLRAIETLASTYWNQGRWTQAEELQVIVMENRQKKLGDEHKDTLNIMNNLALTYSYSGRWTDAEKLQERVLEARKRLLGIEHPTTLASINNLASTYRRQGRFEKAEELQTALLETRRKILGEEHPDTLISISNLVLTYGRQGRFEKAEELQTALLETWRKVLGEEHPNTLTSISNLASTYGRQGRFEKAEELQTAVLETWRKVLGEEHPNTLMSISDLAFTYGRQGRFEKAEELQTAVLETQRKVLGEEHPDTLTSIDNLASTYQRQRRFEKAEELQTAVLETRRKVIGEEHPNTLTSISNLASTYREQGRFEKAEELETAVLKMHRKVSGEEHPATLVSMNNLAVTWKRMGRVQDAFALMKQCISLRVKTLGDNHPRVAGSREWLRIWREEMADRDELDKPDEGSSEPDAREDGVEDSDVSLLPLPDRTKPDVEENPRRAR